jgi:hypothetical protein
MDTDNVKARERGGEPSDACGGNRGHDDELCSVG